MVDEWRTIIKPRLIAENLELQSVDLGAMSDTELADHLERLVARLAALYEEHHRLHGYDLGPIGQFVVASRRWNLPADDVLAALAGASPSTTEPLSTLAEIREAIDAAGAKPTSLDQVRAVSPHAASLLDAYLERHGSVLYTSYDLDSPTLGERPEVILSSILTARRPPDLADRAAGIATGLRARVPANERASFDDYLADARAAMDMRDDNGPVTVEWPAGLLRLAMLEAGQRLVASGCAKSADHIFELDGDEPCPRALRGRANAR
ncbi:MAG: hypothetical protein R2710_08745 [Acidimicrobiales bacterium]